MKAYIKWAVCFLLPGSVRILAPCHRKLCGPASPYRRSSLDCAKYQVAFHRDESNKVLKLSSFLLSCVVEFCLVNLLTSTNHVHEYWNISGVPVCPLSTHGQLYIPVIWHVHSHSWCMGIYTYILYLEKWTFVVMLTIWVILFYQGKSMAGTSYWPSCMLNTSGCILVDLTHAWLCHQS